MKATVENLPHKEMLEVAQKRKIAPLHRRPLGMPHIQMRALQVFERGPAVRRLAHPGTLRAWLGLPRLRPLELQAPTPAPRGPGVQRPLAQVQDAGAPDRRRSQLAG